MITVVIPNHLPHLNILDAWEHKLATASIIVVQDGPEKPVYDGSLDVLVYDWNDIDRELGEDAWIIPRRTSAVRSFGYLMADQRSGPYDVIATLDNDCYPDGSDFLGGHHANLKRKATAGWVTSTADLQFPRGFPYGIRGKAEVALSHGVWSNVPDLDAATSLHNPDLRLPAAQRTVSIPRGVYFPMCGMNLAWRAYLTPAMYFGLFGPDYGFDQYDDIWAGVLVKRVLDHVGLMAVSGYPSINHRKQSNVFANLRKQAPGLEMNENFWLAVDAVKLDAVTIPETYRQLIEGLPDVIEGEPDGWTHKFKEAALIWVGLAS